MIIIQTVDNLLTSTSQEAAFKGVTAANINEILAEVVKRFPIAPTDIIPSLEGNWYIYIHICCICILWLGEFNYYYP